MVIKCRGHAKEVSVNMISVFRRNKFFIIAWLIYFMPTFVFLGYALLSGPKQPQSIRHCTPGVSLIDLVFLIIGIQLLLAFPILALVHLWYIMIPYFVIAYGLLHYFHRKEKKSDQVIRLRFSSDA